MLQSDHLWSAPGRAVLLLALLAPVAMALSSAAQEQELQQMMRIPAGPFLMGTNDGPADERPQHGVKLLEFFIDRLPVTNLQFARFLNAKALQGTAVKRWYDIDD